MTEKDQYHIAKFFMHSAILEEDLVDFKIIPNLLNKKIYAWVWRYSFIFNHASRCWQIILVIPICIVIVWI